ncbi:MAG TPA: signal recognition particle-docking protein FtsY [Euryarchaeota archaeon]|nr:signal recognition particle-docking protein FtsY [Euryarchaeota archaeon]
MFSFLKKKVANNTRKISEALKGEVTLDESRLEDLLFDLEISLIESDVALEVVDKIKDDLKNSLLGKTFERGSDLEEIVKSALRDSLKSMFIDADLVETIKAGKRPFVIAFIGVNGTGKTTTIAKIATAFEKEGLSSVIAACDTYRAGAIEQIEQHAEKLGVRLIKHGPGADAAAVAFDAIEHARAKDKDVVLIDTAGRMDTNVNLMDELKKVVRIAKPNRVIFVGDVLTGNAVVDQVLAFNKYASIDGAILTKADADAKGGAAISVAYILKKPIYYLGTGQEYGDLLKFSSEWFVDELLSE